MGDQCQRQPLLCGAIVSAGLVLAFVPVSRADQAKRPTPVTHPAPARQPGTLARPAVVAPVPVPRGVDFIADARVLFRVGPCASSGELLAHLSPGDVRHHCRHMAALQKRFRDKWMSKARPFFANLVPTDVPTTVVYPFGGGDLMSALTVFPDAREITTLSLEPAGDPRSIHTIGHKHFRNTMAAVRRWIGFLVRANHSRTKDMAVVMNRGKLPGQLLFTLTGLAIHGYEPVGLRYFVIQPSGDLRYLTRADIDAVENPAPSELAVWRRDRKAWRKARRALFRNMEVRFKRPSEPSSATRVYRHIQGNLEDRALTSDRRTLTHLESKGKVTVMTKAASYLLWWGNFSMMRNYLLTHMAWMVSDATGIPPHIARAAGFEQITWGRWRGNILANPGRKNVRRFRELWKSNPYQPLTFRFGYPDRVGNHHLMVTRRRP